jgi:hypothetical protein
MSVENYGWNGSTMSFGGASVIPLVDLRHTNDPATFQTTGSTDSFHTTGAGLPKNGFTASFLGSKCPVAGSIANISATVIPGSAYTYAKSFISQMSVSGRKDGRIEGNLTAVPGADALTAGSFSSGAIGDLGFNGSTFSFKSTPFVGLISANYTSSAAQIDCTGATDTDTLFAPGLVDETLTITCLGAPLKTIKDKGVTAMAWTDGGTLGSGANWELTAIHDGGSIDGQTTTEYSFKPCRSTNTSS